MAEKEDFAKPQQRCSGSSGPTSAGGRGCHEKRMRCEQDSSSPMSPAESPAKRARTGLSADDRPSIRLMQKIVAHVIFGHLQSISNDLEIPEGAFPQAVCNTAGSKPKSQIYKVQWIFGISSGSMMEVGSRRPCPLAQ